MQVIFEKIRYKNILSVGNAWIEINFMKNDMTLCVGKNGGGKSTLIDALTYNLFACAFRNINLSMLVNSVNNKDCLTELYFRAGGKQYKNVRGMKPNIFEIWENGQKLDQTASSKDYQKILEAIIGFNFKTFSQVIVMGSTSYVPFMKLKPSDRRSIIENLLDIEVFGVMGQLAKAENKDLEALMDLNMRQTQTTAEKMALQQKNMELAKKNNDEIIAQKKDELRRNVIALPGFLTDIAKKKDQIDELKKTIADEKKVQDRLRKINDIMIRIEDNSARIAKDLDFYEKNDECPCCHQGLTNKLPMIQEYKSRLAELTEGFKDAKIKKIAAQTRETQINAVKVDIQRIEKDVSDYQRVYDFGQYTIKQLEREIQNLSNKKTISQEMQTISEGLVADMERLSDQRKEQRKQKEYFDVIEMLLKDHGIKAKIIGQYIPVINKLINKYLSEMEFFVDFHLDEEFNETIKSRHRDNYSYDNFSEGQKRRIDIALIFTWREVARLKNSVSTNLLIMDEVLDGSLDGEGIEEFMKLLNVFGKNSNTFLISHRGDVLLDKFEHVIQFKLNGLFTEMEDV